VDEVYVQRLVQEYRGAKDMADAARERSDKLKKELAGLVDEHGYTDHNGHRWLEVGDERLKRERRLSKTFSRERAEEWARAAGRWEEVMDVVEVLSEDKVLALAWDDPDVRDVVDGFYVEREVWAFKA